MRKSKQKAALLLLLCLCSSSLTGCGEKVQEEIMVEEVIVETSLPDTGDLVLNHEFIATISPQESVYVMSMVSAEVLSVLKDTGDTVKAGEALCRMDSDTAKLQLESAQASYNTAQASANQALGGNMLLQDIQTNSGVDTLQKQLNDTNEDLSDAKSDLEDAENDYATIDEWYDEAKERFETAQEDYQTASGLSSSFSSLTGSFGWQSTYGAIGHCTNLSQAVEYLEQSGGSTGDPATDARVTGLYESMKDEGFDDDDITMAGVSRLASEMSTRQSEYQNASSQKATLKQKKQSYEDAIEQIEGGIGNIEDNLNTSIQSAAVAQTQVREEAKAVLDAQLNAASVGIKSAQMQLDMYTLSAPISGTLEAVNVTEHGFAQAGNPAFVISDKETMMATFYVSEKVRSTFSIGQAVIVEHDQQNYTGHITEMEASVDQQTGLFKIKVSVENAEKSLMTGTTVIVRADTYRESDTLILPYDSVYYDNGKSYVYCMEDGKAVQKYVETGLFDTERIAILKGITKDSRVITTWGARLRDGVSVVDAADTQTGDTKSPAESTTETGTESTAETGTEVGTEAGTEAGTQAESKATESKAVQAEDKNAQSKLSTQAQTEEIQVAE